MRGTKFKIKATPSVNSKFKINKFKIKATPSINSKFKINKFKIKATPSVNSKFKIRAAAKTIVFYQQMYLDTSKQQ